MNGNGNVPRPVMSNERLPTGMRQEVEDMIKIDMAETLKPLETSITQLKQTIKERKWTAGIAVPIICSVITAMVAAFITVSQMGG